MPLIDIQDVESLGERGYFIKLAPQELLFPLLKWKHWAHENYTWKRAGTGRNQIQSDIRSDSIAWIDPLDASEGSITARTLFEMLRLELNEKAYLGLKTFELQLAHYADWGSKYDKHVDSLKGNANRRVTAIIYLNEKWILAHGGQLKIHGKFESLVDPLAFRLVVFLSEKIEHEVLPSFADRFALTAWYSADS
jgi:SM-20-related protein